MTTVEERMAAAKEFARRYDGSCEDGSSIRGRSRNARRTRNDDPHGDVCVWHAVINDDGTVTATDWRECESCNEMRAKKTS